jgi:hypothetical protein
MLQSEEEKFLGICRKQSTGDFTARFPIESWIRSFAVCAWWMTLEGSGSCTHSQHREGDQYAVVARVVYFYSVSHPPGRWIAIGTAWDWEWEWEWRGQKSLLEDGWMGRRR